MKNLLIKSDNIIGLNYLLNKKNFKGKIDLVYIDPPFATGGTFTISDGRASTISNSKKGEIAYSDKLIGNEFLEFIKQRLILIKELMSDNGSIYLHIDYKIGHYVKILMDEIFGIENFRNDITRIKCNPKNFNRIGYGNIKDLILFYTKSNKPIWNEPREKYTEKDYEKLFPKINKQGRRYTTVPIHAPGETANGKSSQSFKGILPPKGRHWRTDVATLEQWDKDGLIEWSSTGNPRKIIFADEREGKRVQDIWEYKDPQYPIYPTEKNPDLLDLIIRTSSNENSIILDCFSGSGTTLKAAQINGRKWIGI
ncbi:MAG: site-specific DNA-methyltransferase, partial [Bacteroidales bacterium]|nr:site-specific DNA-methyltransferase [Bacteroidales bacterium]